MPKDLTPGATFYHLFTTTNGDNAPATLAGSPAISVYKDNDPAESTSGVTLTPDHDGVTGLALVEIDTSSDPTFYSSGGQFALIITAGDVAGESAVGFKVGEFTLDLLNAGRIADAVWDEANADHLASGSMGETLDKINSLPTPTDIADAVRAAQLTETYHAVGTVPTLEQAVMLILQMLTEFYIVDTTNTVKRTDQITPAATFEFDDPDNPTSITRTS